MWEAVLISGSSRVKTREDIVPENLDPMGPRDRVLSSLENTFSGKNIPGTGRVVARGGNFDIHFDAGEDDPVREIRLITNGEPYYIIELLYEKYKWKALDLQMNEIVEIDPEKPENQRPEPRENRKDVPEETMASGKQGTAFLKYFSLVAAVLVLEAIARPYFGSATIKGLFSTAVSLCTLFILYRFGRNDSSVGKGQALIMSLAVSLLLVALNLAKNWEIASRGLDGSIVKALSFAFILKAGIYYLFIFLGIKIRISKEEGEPTLEFRWR
ncbi:MAG: hypothetical protein K6T66_02035 [Peptococcaceae bacterium]|nr:hypothetical protein [Peptococcaceae bacterium]